MNISFKDPRVPETFKKIEMTQMIILPKTQMYLNELSDCARESFDI